MYNDIKRKVKQNLREREDRELEEVQTTDSEEERKTTSSSKKTNQKKKSGGA